MLTVTNGSLIRLNVQSQEGLMLVIRKVVSFLGLVRSGVLESTTVTLLDWHDSSLHTNFYPYTYP